MNRFAYAALILLAGVPASAQKATIQFETRDEAIEAANAVEIRGAMKVAIITGGDAASVRFQGPSNLLADAQARIDNGTLIIGFRDDTPHSWDPGAGVDAVVMLPAVASVQTFGPAQVEVIGVSSDTFLAETNGAGRVKVSGLQVDRVAAAIGGSGQIELEGQASSAKYAISGAGSIEAKRLRVANAQIALGGAGRVYADVSDQAQVSVGGSGKVEIVGGAQCSVSPNGSRNVDCR